jgi:ribosomal protein L7Ae-like RNA K-turn-binding protein
LRKKAESDALGLLGLARRAGAVVPGVDGVRRALKGDEVKVVLVARDAAEGQTAKVKGVLRHREVPVRWVSTRAALGAAVGAPELSVVGVTMESFAESLARGLPPTGWNAA